MKICFSLTFLACLYVFLPCAVLDAQADDRSKDLSLSKEITVPKSTPRMKLLGVEFVLVENVMVPKSIAIMRDRWRQIQEEQSNTFFHANTIPLKKERKSQWQALVKISKNSPDQLKTLRNINGFFNSVPSRDDLDFYGTKEYWATPWEFLHHNKGDCEDYAITKYFALQYMGWKAKDLWLVFLKENIRDSGHAVLVAHSKKGKFVLDNLSKPKHLLIPSKTYEKNVTPFAIANHRGLWLRIQKQEEKSTANTQP